MKYFFKDLFCGRSNNSYIKRKFWAWFCLSWKCFL